MAHQIEVVAVQAKRIPYLLNLIDEPVDLPKVGIIGLVAIRRAQLVVIEVLDAGRWEIAVTGFPVLVSRGRPAVQQQHLGFRVVANTLGPNFEVAFRGLDPDHLDAAAENVVAAGVVEVPTFSFYQSRPHSLVSWRDVSTAQLLKSPSGILKPIALPAQGLGARF